MADPIHVDGNLDRRNCLRVSVTPSRLTFGVLPAGKTTLVGKIDDPATISRISGMVLLPNGVRVPIPFIHPTYMDQSMSVLVGGEGNVSVILGAAAGITSGYVDVY